ncbi:MAGE family-domain-containing protein [Phlyctochytrium arcticum]|nr:MAGE family-domain-containing protein [Phlyctochytrium arcticum]
MTVAGSQRRSGRHQIEDPFEQPSQGSSQSFHQTQDAPSQITNTNAERLLQSLPSENTAQKVKELVRLALSTEHRKVPLRREEINKKVLKEHTRVFPAIFERANDRLRSIFGFEMVELPAKDMTAAATQAQTQTQTQKNGPGAKTVVKSSRAYILRSILPVDQRITRWGAETPEMVLTCLILCIIMVNGRQLDEGRLLGYLARLGIGKDDSVLEYDTPMAFLSHMTKQNYLIRNKIQMGEMDTYDYFWGPRAKIELPEEHAIEFIAEAYDDLTPDVLARLRTDIERLAGPSEGGEAEDA